MHIVVIKLNRGLKTWAYFHSICPEFAFDLGHIAAAHLADRHNATAQPLGFTRLSNRTPSNPHLLSRTLWACSHILFLCECVYAYARVFLYCTTEMNLPCCWNSWWIFLAFLCFPLFACFQRYSPSTPETDEWVVSYSNVRGVLRLA